MSDYIEREALFKTVEDYASVHPVMHDNELFALFCSIPAADVAPVKHGHWVGEYDGYADGFPVYDMWSCSVCGWDCDGVDEEPTWDYCPHCGAHMDMDKEADE